jgi:hypothetical protein
LQYLWNSRKLIQEGILISERIWVLAARLALVLMTMGGVSGI